jgi:hypothetical protein
MEMDNPRPVRFRVVLELVFPDADPWDPADYDKPLEQLKTALESAPNVNCKEVMIREATTIGDDDNYEDWRGGWKYDFSSFRPNTIYLFGVGAHPVPVVDPADLGRVWEVLSKAEAGQLGDVNVAIAVGQALGIESNAQATLARVYILRALQRRNAIPGTASPALFEKAASFPIDHQPASESELDALVSFFGD